MFLFAVENDVVLKAQDLTVNPCSEKTHTAKALKILAMFALPSFDHRCQDSHPGLVLGLHQAVDYLLRGLGVDPVAALIAVGYSYPCKEKTQIVVDLCYSSNRRTRIPADLLLLDGYCRREPLYGVHIGLIHLFQELSRVCRKGFHVSALPLRIQGVKSERGFSRSRDTCYDHEGIPGYLNADVFQVVFPCALYDYFIG